MLAGTADKILAQAGQAAQAEPQAEAAEEAVAAHQLEELAAQAAAANVGFGHGEDDVYSKL